MKLVVVGPCGVGKSRISRIIAENANVVYIDFDEIRAADMNRRRGQVSPCSVSRLNLRKCIPYVLDPYPEGFILDMGGDTVFRSNADNENRFEQVMWLKQTYSASITLITAEEKELCQRFLASKNRGAEEFDNLWQNWQTIEEPYWRRCADVVIDSTGLSLDAWRRLPTDFPNLWASLSVVE